MDYKKMWEDLKGLMQKTEKMTDLIKTKGILDIIFVSLRELLEHAVICNKD